MIFDCILQFGARALGSGWVVGGEGGGKPPGHRVMMLQSIHRNHQAEETSLWSWEQFFVDGTQLVRSTGTNVLVMVLQGPPEKQATSVLALELYCMGNF